MSQTDWGGDIGGGPPGASPEGAGALIEQRKRRRGPRDDNPEPRPGCLRTLLAIVLVVVALAALWFVFVLVVELLS